MIVFENHSIVHHFFAKLSEAEDVIPELMIAKNLGIIYDTVIFFSNIVPTVLQQNGIFLFILQ